jgi:hypothetical protein
LTQSGHRHSLKIECFSFPEGYSGHVACRNDFFRDLLISYTLPTGLSLWGAAPTPLFSLFIYARAGMGFGDAFLTALMTATMAAVFCYTGFSLLRQFGLPADRAMLEFHKFMRGDEY